MTMLAELPTMDGRRIKEGEDMPATKTIDLTDRDEQLLRAIVNGKTYPQIAHNLQLSLETIKSYMARLRAKLGVDNKVGLALWAQKNLR